MSEKRRLRRIQLKILPNVYKNGKDKIIGQVLDIHAEGFLLMAQKPIQPGTEQEFRLVFPKKILDKEAITFEAECVWTAKAFEPEFYNMGFRFLNPASENRSAIETLIHQYGRT